MVNPSGDENKKKLVPGDSSISWHLKENRKAMDTANGGDNQNKNNNPIQAKNEEKGLGSSEIAVIPSESSDANLETLEKVLKMLKRRDSKEFVAVLEKVMIGGMAVDLERKKLFYELLGTFLEEINFCQTTTALVHLKESLKSCFEERELRNLTIDSSSLEIMNTTLPSFWKHVTVPHVLGKGAFSTVYKGTWKKSKNENVTVAIKVALMERFEKMTIAEAKILANLKHPNIIKVLGFVRKTDEDSPSKFILEFMSLGNLSHARENCSFSVDNVFNILKDVASAMEYVAGKKYIHRDIAVRNVFINGKKQTKLADFGLAQYVGDTDGVYRQEDFTLSSYNISPESYLSQEYRTETDVWAFGLFIWELFYFLQQDDNYPRHMMVLNSKDSLGLFAFYAANAELPKPPKCPLPLFNFVKQQCMNEDYRKRPSFTFIKAKIETLMRKDNDGKKN